MKIVDAGGESFRGSMRAALGCTESTPWQAEFWVQSSKAGQPACHQHVAGVIRRELAHSRAVVVDQMTEGRPCLVAGDPSIPPPPT